MEIKKERAIRLTGATIFCAALTLIIVGVFVLDRNKNQSLSSSSEKTSIKCETLDLSPNQSHTVKIADGSSCFNFNTSSGQILSLSTDVQATLISPQKTSQIFKGLAKISLLDGIYQLKVLSGKDSETHQIVFTISGKELPAQALPQNSSAQSISYNVKTKPPFVNDKRLQKIVDRAVDSFQQKGYSIKSISISLVDLNSSSCCGYASFQDQQPRFPASIPKLFWMVALYGQYQEGMLKSGAISEQDVYKMIQNSDNQPASRVLDKVTQTESGQSLSSNEFNQWMSQRTWVNKFFEDAGYQNINISQKNFPIPYLGLTAPQGRDLQLRQINGDSSYPFRNYLTAYDTSRLLYEVDTDQAISQAYSQKMKLHLRRDLHPEAWEHIQYNSIKGFLGEYLPTDTYFMSKVGWTSDSRSDAAIIATPDGKTRYALVIYSEGGDFAEDWTIFPKISRSIYDQMTGSQ
jgi:Beta-lactamase enzyme family